VSETRLGANPRAGFTPNAIQCIREGHKRIVAVIVIVVIIIVQINVVQRPLHDGQYIARANLETAPTANAFMFVQRRDEQGSPKSAAPSQAGDIGFSAHTVLPRLHEGPGADLTRQAMERICLFLPAFGFHRGEPGGDGIALARTVNETMEPGRGMAAA
jgi:hypothetical protein